MSRPLRRLLRPVGNKDVVAPPIADDFSSPMVGCVFQSSAAPAHIESEQQPLTIAGTSAAEFNRTKSGSCSAPSYFHSGTVFLSTFRYLKIKRNSL